MSALILMGECASKTRALNLVHPFMHSELKPQTEIAISLIGKNFDVGGFPFNFIVLIIFVKDVVTFGSFKSI